MNANTICTLVLHDDYSNVIVGRGKLDGIGEGYTLLGGHIFRPSSGETIKDVLYERLNAQYGISEKNVDINGILGVWQYLLDDTWMTNIVCKGSFKRPYSRGSSWKIHGFSNLYSLPRGMINDYLPLRTKETLPVLRESFKDIAIPDLSSFMINDVSSGTIYGYSGGSIDLPRNGTVTLPPDKSFIPTAIRNEYEKIVLGVVIPVRSYSPRYVLVKTNRDGPDNGKLSLPGGKVNAGEDILSCSVREVEEETGIRIENPTINGIQVNFFPFGYFTTVSTSSEPITISEFDAKKTIRNSDEISDIVAFSFREIEFAHIAGILRTNDTYNLIRKYDETNGSDRVNIPLHTIK